MAIDKLLEATTETIVTLDAMRTKADNLFVLVAEYDKQVQTLSEENKMLRAAIMDIKTLIDNSLGATGFYKDAGDLSWGAAMDIYRNLARAVVLVKEP